MVDSFFQKRFILISGKGGVGRSTCCAAIALAAAQRGQRVLVCELNTKERIPSLLGGRPTGGRIGRVRDGIDAVNIRPQAAMAEYGVMKLKLRALYRLAFENRAVSAILGFIPGLPELLMLGKAFFHEAERLPNGKPRWDLLVVDVPASGHGMPLLRIPDVVLSVTQTGPMAEDARAMAELLADPRRTSLNIVTTPETMAVEEAIDLYGQTRTHLHTPNDYLFFNGVMAPPMTSEQEVLCAELTQHCPDEGVLRGPLESLSRRQRRWQRQESLRRELEKRIDLPLIDLPRLATPSWNLTAISQISEALVQSLATTREGSS